MSLKKLGGHMGGPIQLFLKVWMWCERGGDRSKWAEEGRRRKEREQAAIGKTNLKDIKKKKKQKPTPSHIGSSHFTLVEKSTEQRRISTDRLCLDEKQNQQKALLMQEGMHQKRFSPSQSPALLSNIFNAEQCPQTTKHCSWTLSWD